MSATLGTAERPLRVAIIGAGPAGFYAAEALLKQQDLNVHIDFFNRVPTPYGLVREGVAPDHQSIKSVTRVYDKLAAGITVRYFGNVTFGQDISHEDLKARYDQIIYAVGTPADRRMGIPGEDLAGSVAATRFVGWYNGHPDYAELEFNLDHERVVVVGNGNVAMDAARILVTDPDELAKTDIADYALSALRTNKVREVVVLGRRGPAQAAFTNPELKEFGELAGVDVIVSAEDLCLDPQSEASLADDKIARKNVEILREYAARPRTGAERRIIMRFLASPVEVIGADGHVTALKIERNALVATPEGDLRAQGSGEFETITCGMVIRSVGYKGVPLPGVPYNNARGIIPNVAGRVTPEGMGVPLPGEYVVGWAKRGPSGVIGTNKPDAAATVAAMIEDLPALAGAPTDSGDIVELLSSRQIEYVDYRGWRAIDDYELAQGKAQGRPRVKETDVERMLAIARQAKG